MVQSLVLAAVVLSGHAPLPVLYGLALVTGVLTAFDNPARRAFVVEMVPADMVPNAVSLNSAVMTGSRVVGPAAAGLLVVTVGYGWAFLIDGLSYIAVLWGLRAMSVAELHPSTPTPRGAGPGARGPALRPLPARPAGAAGDDGGHRHPRLQLLRHPAAARHRTARAAARAPSPSCSRCSASGRSSVRSGPPAAPTSPPRQVAVAAAGFGVTMLLLAAAPTLLGRLPRRDPARASPASAS